MMYVTNAALQVNIDKSSVGFDLPELEEAACIVTKVKQGEDCGHICMNNSQKEEKKETKRSNDDDDDDEEEEEEEEGSTCDDDDSDTDTDDDDDDDDDDKAEEEEEVVEKVMSGNFELETQNVEILTAELNSLNLQQSATTNTTTTAGSALIVETCSHNFSESHLASPVNSCMDQLHSLSLDDELHQS